jgi:hypothetical protein
LRRTCQGGIAGRGGEGHGGGIGYAELEAVVLTELTRYSYKPQVPSKYSGPGLGRDGGVSLIAVGPRAKKGGGPKQAGGGRGFEEWGTVNRARVRKEEVPFEGGFDTNVEAGSGCLLIAANRLQRDRQTRSAVAVFGEALQEAERRTTESGNVSQERGKAALRPGKGRERRRGWAGLRQEMESTEVVERGQVRPLYCCVGQGWRGTLANSRGPSLKRGVAARRALAKIR